jgi:RND family efflux transporter MFP subunit
VTPGNLVIQDQTSLSTIVSLDPIYVYFDVDERTLLKLKSVRDKEQPVLVGLATEDAYPRKGLVNLVSNRFNTETGTVSIRAALTNQDRSLSPGMFVRVRLPLGAPHKALLVPNDAIWSDQGRLVLYIVDEKNKVISRRVVVGASHDGWRVIEKGIQPDERFIIKGDQKILPGTTVKPVESDKRPSGSNP